jgi:photosystem II stability/assembly factor-like uncharacterized protein
MFLEWLRMVAERQNNMRFDFRQQAAWKGLGIRGLSVVDGKTAWLGISQGKFARTLDAGTTWQFAEVPGYPSLDFRSVKAFDQETALIASAGQPAVILKTSDGGSSWKEVFVDSTGTAFLDCLAFRDENEGLALGDPDGEGCYLLRTMDGGENWSRIAPATLPAMQDGEAFFAASGTCLSTFNMNGLCFTSGGSVSRVFWSEDRGSSWAVTDIPLLNGASSQGGFSIAVHDGMQACVVGGDYAQDQVSNRTVVHTCDGGRNWLLAEVFPPGGYNSCVAYVPGTDGLVLLATGTRGTHLSEDGGSTWRQLDVEPFHVLGFEGTGRSGWAAGADGRVSRIELVRA